MSEFIDGFADETELSHSEADEQWAAFSRQLPDAEREAIEAGGYASGLLEGEEFRKMFPEDSDEAAK